MRRHVAAIGHVAVACRPAPSRTSGRRDGRSSRCPSCRRWRAVPAPSPTTPCREVAERRVGLDHDQDRAERHQRHRDQVLGRIERQLGVERRVVGVGRVGGDQEGVAVGRRPWRRSRSRRWCWRRAWDRPAPAGRACAVSPSAMTRTSASIAPPGLNGTTMRTGLVGQVVLRLRREGQGERRRPATARPCRILSWERATPGASSLSSDHERHGWRAPQRRR